MIKLLIKVIKRIIVSMFLLYGLNLITSNLDFIIPINYITVLVVCLLGIPGVIALITLSFFI